MKQKLDSQSCTPFNINEIDVKILKALLIDARTPFADIARDCGVSTTTIVKHYYRLKQSGIILGTVLRVNPKDLGYAFRLTIDINIFGGYESKNIFELCKKMPDARLCYPVIGKYDIHAVVYLKNFEQIEEIRDIVRRQKGVRRVGVTATYEGGFFPENLIIECNEVSENG